MSFSSLRDKYEYGFTWTHLSESDVHALGLRHLSRSQLRRAVTVLEQIYEHIYGPPPKTREYKKTLDTLTGKYYAIVPASTQRVIDTKIKVAIKLATCEYLGCVPKYPASECRVLKHQMDAQDLPLRHSNTVLMKKLCKVT